MANRLDFAFRVQFAHNEFRTIKMGDWQNLQEAMANGLDFAPRVQLAHNETLNVKIRDGQKPRKAMANSRALEEPWQTAQALRLGYSPRTMNLEL